MPGTSEARKYSPSPTPRTAGGPKGAATSLLGSLMERTPMANAPVRRLTALLTASSKGMEEVRGRFRTASELLESGDSEVVEPTLCDEAAKDGPPGVGAVARLSSFSMRWAMISVAVSETDLWPLA